MGNRTIEFLLLARDKASQTLDKVGAAAGRAGRGMQDAGGHAAAMGGKLALLAGGGVLALGALAAGAVKTGLETASMKQQADIAFTQLLHSGGKAKDFLADLSSFAASTPFELSGLIDSSRLLIGVGQSTKQTKQILQDFGDTSGALGIQQDAFNRIILATSQALSAGKFQQGDLNQIMTNGIPIYTILSKAMGKSVPEIRAMASHGKLLASDVMPLLHSQMQKDYGGSMAKQSQTLSGLWSTMKDTMALGMADVLQPLVPLLQQTLPGAMDAMGKGLSTLAGWIKTGVEWGGKLKGWLDGLGKGGQSSEFLQKLGKTVGDMATQIRTFAGPALKQIGQIITTQVVPALAAFGKAMEPIVLWFAAKLGPIVVSVLKTVLTVIQGAVKIIAGIFNVLAGVLTGDWHRAWDGIKQILSGAWDAIWAILRNGVTIMKQILSMAIDELKAIGGRILGGLLDGLKAGWGKVEGFFKNLTDKIPDWKGPAKRDKELLTPAGKSIMGSLISGFRAAEPDVASYLQRFTDTIASRKITQAARTAITRIVRDVGDELRAKTDQLKAISQRIADQRQAVADLVRARSEYAGTLAEAAAGGGITSLTLLQLDDQGRNAAAQQKLTDAQGAQRDAVDALTEARQRLVDLQAQEAARDVSSISQLQQLRDAREAVTAAEAAAAVTATKLAAAQKAADGANTNRAVDVRDQLAKRYDDLRAFWGNLEQLKARGLNAGTLQEIAQAGVEQGGAMAAALAEGGADTLKQINDLQLQIKTTSDAFGKKWAGQQYDAGVQAALGLVKGLQSQQSVLEQAVAQMGTALVASIRRSLGIKSPSRVFADQVGAHIPTGIAMGIVANRGAVEDALAGVVPGPGGVVAAGGGRAGAGGTTVVENHYHFPQGVIMGTPAQVVRELDKVIGDAAGSGVRLKNLAAS